MASSSNRALAAVVAAFCLAATNVVQRAEAHPNCLGDFAPDLDADAQFCPDTNVDGFCCNGAQETSIQANYDSAGVTGTCAELYQEVVCGICHPWSGHLFERLGNAMTLTNDFCSEFYSECSGQLNLPADYCDIHTGSGDGDAFYAYPYVADDSFSGEGLIKPFPGIDGDLPTNPLDMRMTPDGSKWWVLGLEGEIVEFDAVNPSGVTQVMDISSKIRLTFEEGLLGMAFSPGFHTTGVFYVTYVMTEAGQNFGSNRLSKFTYSSSASATANSEVVLITSVPKASEVHSAGWVGFKPSAYSSDDPGATHELYWSMGDAGPQEDTQNHGQNPATLHGSIMRIVVDSTMSASYTVPSSNPFSGGGGKPEICAQGFRNPFKCSFDRANDELYCGDVGQYRVETVKKIECGNNYGWRKFEGERCLLEREDEFEASCEDLSTSGFTFPIYSYCHPDYYPMDEPSYLVPDNYCGDRSIVGNAVIGGFVYRGVKYADLLLGNYVFAEYQKQGLHNLYPTGNGYNYATIKNNDFFKAVSFAEDNDGELYLIAYKGDIYEMPCGDICDGENVNPIGLPEPVIPEPVTPEPETPVPTPAPVAGDTPAPVAGDTPAPVAGDTPAPAAGDTPAPVAGDTPAPVAAATDAPVLPATPAPTEAPTPAPFTFAPLSPGETAAPSTASPTPAPVTTAPTSLATPAPVAKVTTAPVAEEATPAPAAEEGTPAPAAEETTPAPTAAETAVEATVAPVAPVAPEPDPTTLAPIMIRTAPPTATPEPTSPRTASPERVEDDSTPPPLRTATEPPTTTTEPPTTPAPFAPVPVEPEDPVPREPTSVPEQPEPTAEPRAPTAVPERPTAQAPTVVEPPTPTTAFVCDGLLSPLGQYCCPTECGECGGVGCSSRPGGADNCCTSHIKASGALCEVTRAAPCHIPVEDTPIPAPAPTTPEAPPTSDRIEPTTPKTPGRPSSAVPPVSPEDLELCNMEYGEDVVPMTGPEYDVVTPPEHLGCFVDDPSDRLLTLAYNESSAMTPTLCSSMCSDVGGDTFGVQYGHECWCGDSRDNEVSSYGRTDCDMPCSGDASVTCGGRHRLDAYYIGGGPKVPENSAYLGCYLDDQRNRAQTAGFLWCNGKMTVPVCEQYCRSKHAVVYALQYGHECWCGDHMDYDQYGPGQCDYRCSGDMHTTCGGYTASSVYALHY